MTKVSRPKQQFSTKMVRRAQKAERRLSGYRKGKIMRRIWKGIRDGTISLKPKVDTTTAPGMAADNTPTPVNETVDPVAPTP